MSFRILGRVFSGGLRSLSDELGVTSLDELGDTPLDELRDTPLDELGDTPLDEPGDTPLDEPGDIPLELRHTSVREPEQSLLPPSATTCPGSGLASLLVDALSAISCSPEPAASSGTEAALSGTVVAAQADGSLVLECRGRGETFCLCSKITGRFFLFREA